MPSSTVSSKGQVTIPKAVRDALHIDTGDRVLFLVRQDGVVELRAESIDVLDLVGILEPPGDARVTVEEMDNGIGRHVADAFRRSVSS